MNINFTKYADGLVPAIIQDANTKSVLMLGFMNQAAVDATISLKNVTFFSRSKNRLWTKGEESGNFLQYISMALDCDQDTLLIQAVPLGPVCHTGTSTCWGDDAENDFSFAISLSAIGRPSLLECRILLTTQESKMAMASRAVDLPAPFTP